LLLRFFSLIDEAFNGIVSAVRNKEISESRIDESVRRILAMKAAAGLNQSRFVDLTEVKRLFPDSNAANLAQQACDQAVTLVRTNGRVLPLPSNKNGEAGALRSIKSTSDPALVVVSFLDSKSSRLGHEFDRQLETRRPDASIFHYYNDHIGSDATPLDVLSQVKSASNVVIAAFVTHVPGRQVVSRGKPMVTVGLSGGKRGFP
jgi:beta-N-acetylhexosaminidase